MPAFLDRRLTLWIVVAFATFLWLVANLPWNLDEYDQAKQAFTSFEMVTQGHWFYQHTPNYWVATKPPLVGWASAAFFGITRSWEWAWRLPSLVAALLLLLLIVRAASAYGVAAAAVAAAAFSLNLFTPRLATLVRTDMPLALIIFALGLGIWQKIRVRQKPGFAHKLWFCALLTAGMLAKGPIIFAFLLPGIIFFQVAMRRRDEPVTAWPSSWPIAISLLVLLVWAIVGLLIVPDFWEHVIVREFAGRFDEVTHRPQPFYFYLPHFLHRFAPWSLLLVLLVLLDWKEQRGRVRERCRAISPETFWLIAWSFGGLLAMSVVPSKRIDRIFPIVPPLCLLLAVQVSTALTNPRRKEFAARCCQVAILLAGLFTAGYVGQRVFLGFRHQTDALARFGAQVREESSAHGWRYAVVGGEDEGMALYLRKTEFLEPDDAELEWRNARLDGLVVPEEELGELLPRLEGATPSRIGPSNPGGRYKRRYVFLVRSE